MYKPSNESDVYGLSYSDFVVPVVKAIQELSKKTDEVAELKKEVADLKEMVAKLIIKTTTTAQLTDITLDQNNPNPFATITRINYSIPNGVKKAELLIADISGKRIQTNTFTYCCQCIYNT